jgi:hypothetical protein
MKIIVIAGIFFLMIQCTGNTENQNHIDAVYITHPVTIDGVLREPSWELISPIILKENHSGNTVSDPRVKTRVKACYDDSTVYFAFICNDPDIWTSFTQRDDHLWEEEAVEIFIDVDNVPETYVEIEVSPANVLFDSYIVDPQNIDVPETALFNLHGIKTAVHVSGTLNKRDDTDDKWTVEIALPFKDLANENIPRVNKETSLKINFYRLDKNRGMERMSYAWSPTGGRFHKPALFGSLVFK